MNSSVWTYTRDANVDIVLVALLKACAKKKDLYEGNRLHADILKRGFLHKNAFIGSTLVNVYAKCGVLAKARQVFDELPLRSAVSWNVLAVGYAQHGRGEEALHCFEEMQCKGFSPDAVTFACMLKACGSIGAAEKGKEIHDEIVRKGLLGKDNVLGTALVDMYAKCGALAKAQEVFDKLLTRDVVAWTALITGYCQHGHGEQALKCFERMQHEGLSPNAMTFACILKACGNSKAVERGKEIHAEIERKGLLRKDNVLGNALVDMYAKCGALAQAQNVFDMLKVRNVVSWTALIVGYCQQGHGEEALKCYERMQEDGLSPDAVTFAHVLQACGSIREVRKGKEIHAEILRERLLGKHRILGNALVDMYAKCGALESAQEVFDKLFFRDIVSWNALIAGYCQHRLGEEALDRFELMQKEGLSPDAVTCASILQACGSIGAAKKGKEIHAEIARKGLLERNIVLGNALVDMYAKCGGVSKAQEVFNDLSVRDVVSWNALIAGYAQVGGQDIVFDLFNKMKGEGTEPSLVTYILVLDVCRYFGLVDKGQSYFETMSSSHGIIPTLKHHTRMVDLFGHAGDFDKAMAMMPSCGYLPAWFALLRACQRWGNVKLGILAFEHVIHLDVNFARAYVCMSDIYAAAGMQEDADKTLAKAKQVFDELPIGDVSSWNALIAGYCKHAHGKEALNCFEHMESKGLSPNVVTFLCILKACGSIGAIEKGEVIHDEIIRRGLLDEPDVLGTALVDMYAKCGALVTAQEVFDSLRIKDKVSWTVLITGYCQHGHGQQALHCFDRMTCEGLSPDVVTFACILKACGILGAVEKGQTYFETMSSSYGIVSNSKHHTLLVDILSCAGQSGKALEMVKKMPSLCYTSGWFALLGACRKWGNEKVGRVAFDHAVLLDEKTDAQT